MKTSLYPEPRRRELFPFVADTVYLAASAETPLCAPAYEAMEGYLKRHRQEGMGCFGATLVELDRCRERICRLLGVEDPENVALVPNTTAGATCLAHSLPLEAGDWILSNEFEFPTNLWPWEDAAVRAGARVVRLSSEDGRVGAEQVREKLASGPVDWGRCRALAWSWVQFRDGYRIDLSTLGEIAREHDALVAVDGIQGLGVVPFDMADTPVDAIYAGSHKWLLGQGGAGFLWVAPEAMERLGGFGRGWLSVVDPMRMDPDDSPRASARRFEAGNFAVASYFALSAGLELLLGLEIREIYHHVQHLLDHLLEALEGSPYCPASCREREHRSGILSLEVPHEDVSQLAAALAEKGFVCTTRGGRLRVAPHLYNTIEEMDALAAALRGLAP